MTLYRFEHPDTERGPYSTTLYESPERDALDEAHRLLSAVRTDDVAGSPVDPHPTPYQEDLYTFSYSHNCGFSSLEQLAAWFAEDVRECLARAGFELAVFEAPVDAVEVGVRQVVFLHDEVSRIGSLNPVSLANMESAAN